MLRKIALLCSVYFLAISPRLTSAMTDEQKAKIHEVFQTLGMECIKDHQISEEAINAMRDHKLPKDENVPCFLACMMKKGGIMDDKGMLQKEKALEQAKKIFNNEEELKRIEGFLHSCSHINTESVADGDKGCDRALMSYKCMVENASQFGFEV